MRIFGVIVVFIMTVAGIFFNIETLTFVPFQTHSSRLINVDANRLVTLKKYHFQLKWAYPNIAVIDSIQALNDDAIAVLPWNTKHSRLVYMRINGHSFYESIKGAIQIKSIKFKPDGYADFLKNRITLTAGGTVVLARGVHKLIQRKQDVMVPWEHTKHLFENSDINMVNFKSPLVANFTYPKSSWVLVGQSRYAEGMKAANIHLVSLAGNHMGDAKKEGLIETINTLHDNDIETVGAGYSMQEAYRCKRIIVNQKSFGFLAFNNVPGSIGKAAIGSPGIAWLDTDALAAIKRCDAKVDQLLVMVNWGTEYTHVPRKIEQNWAKEMIKAGADIILGDQAHWVQTHQTINGKHVSYGLGNYIFDQYWSEKTTEGIIQKFIFHQNKLKVVDTIPIKLFKDGRIEQIQKSSHRYFKVMDVYHGITSDIKSANLNG